VRDERADELEDAFDGHALDSDQTAADESLVLRVHDEDAVGEPVQADRVQMERTDVAWVAWEEARVAVARAERRDDPENADEQLVARDRRCARRERVDLGLEALPRDVPEGRGVNPLDGVPEVANVGRGGRLRGRTSLRRRDERDHGDEREEQARRPHGPGSCAIGLYMSKFTY
jgi:hypothetical protein